VNYVSYSFAILFLTVFVCRLTLGRRKIERSYVGVLLVASLVFYAWHVPLYLVVLLANSLIDYASGRALARPAASAARRRAILAASVTANLSMLGFFKYAGFGLSIARDVAAQAGFSPAIPEIELVLPIGISFYTFQSMSYTIDVYRGRLAPLGDYRSFLLFIAFFPQLVAGPIVRATEFVPQLPRIRRPHLQVINEGLFLVSGGYFLKMVCADNLAVFVNRDWHLGYGEGVDSGILLWLSVMFGAQIFCDFAGYSHIARGLALLLGFRLPVNFNAPYIAGSFQNFWERWHITLSSWLRDYLYTSLGGNRISRGRTYVNLMVVMLLGGLWHGAAFTFIAWGAIHGVALAIERGLGLQGRGRTRPVAVRVMWALVVQAVVLVAWIFFRSEHLAGAWQFCRNIAALEFGLPSDAVWAGSLFLLPIVVIHLWRLGEERGLIGALRPSHKAALTGVLLVLTATSYGPTNAFIYFQF
jgi:D-alanyl-lipoteichoic acid acyltransferase DltB (MBOAT superfamily)